jgi:hypothetical protein
MPQQKITTVYQFDELDEEAKERAREWYRAGNCEDSSWSEAVIDDAAEIATMLGIDLCQTAYKTMGGETKYKPTVYFSGFWSQGDGACFEGTWRARDVQADKLKADAPQDKELHRIADGLAELAKEYPDGYFSVKHRGHYSHSGCTSFDVELPNSALDEMIYGSFEYQAKESAIRHDEETLIQLARDFMDWIYKQLKKEWDYQNSDEQVEESIRANEYEFLETGERA